MNLLLDTHILLWWLGDDPQLTKEARHAISDTDNVIYVSAVSLWEIAIKSGIGKLDLPDDFDDALAAQGFRELPIKWVHARGNRELPWIHRDPFDRMLVAQAQSEGLTLVTADRDVLAYDVPRLPSNTETFRGKAPADVAARHDDYLYGE